PACGIPLPLPDLGQRKISSFQFSWPLSIRSYDSLLHFPRRQYTLLHPRLAHGVVPFPKLRPVITIERRHARISRNDGAKIRPIRRLLDELRPERIEQNIVRAGETERPPLALTRP